MGDISLVDKYRLNIWNHSDKFMHYGKYYGDEIVKSPFSLYYQMETPREILNLKITTTLRRCWGKNCQAKAQVRQTPYVWWYSGWALKYRECFDCLSPIQREMLNQIYVPRL